MNVLPTIQVGNIFQSPISSAGGLLLLAEQLQLLQTAMGTAIPQNSSMQAGWRRMLSITREVSLYQDNCPYSTGSEQYLEPFWKMSTVRFPLHVYAIKNHNTVSKLVYFRFNIGRPSTPKRSDVGLYTGPLLNSALSVESISVPLRLALRKRFATTYKSTKH